MPTNDQDARALTYLARRLRHETRGARAWDEAGTYATIVKYLGQNLAETVERVARHAADPEARTPGAIGRPFVPDAQAGVRRDDTPTHLRCTVCYKPQPECERVRFADDDHTFEPAALDRKRDPDTIRQIVEATKAEVELTKAASEPAPVPVDPNVQALRGVMSAPDTHHTTQETPT